MALHLTIELHSDENGGARVLAGCPGCGHVGQHLLKHPLPEAAHISDRATVEGVTAHMELRRVISRCLDDWASEHREC